MQRWSRRNAVQPHGVRGEARGQLARRDLDRPRGRGRRAAAWSSSPPAARTTRRPAARCRPRSAAAPGRRRTRQRARPPRGLADCFSSGLSRPPCIRCTTNVTGAKSSRRYLPRRPTPLERVAVGAVGRRHGRLERGEGDRREPGQHGAGELRRSSRSAWACTSGSSGIGLPVVGPGAHGGEDAVEGRRTPPGCRAAAAESPPSLDAAGHERLWALSSPVATAAAVSQSWSKRHVRSGCAGPAPTWTRPRRRPQVVRHVALGPVGHDLRDAELRRRPPPASAALAPTSRRGPRSTRGSGNRITAGRLPGRRAAKLVRRRARSSGAGTKVFDAAPVRGRCG